MPKQKDGLKICSKCKCVKPISEYSHVKKNPDGFEYMCKSCKRAYRTSPFYKERERQLEKTSEWKSRKYKYGSSPKGKNYKSKESHRQITRKLGSTIEHTLSHIEWAHILTKQNNCCAVCRIEFNQTTPAVHDCIVPLSKGGALTFENTQALCLRCNAVKHTKIYSGLGNDWRSP